MCIRDSYSGWRPQELGLIEMDRVDLDNWEFTGGIKTDAGIDRLVPIHPRIRELVKQKYDEAIRLGSDYLINCIDSQRTVSYTHLGDNEFAKNILVKLARLSEERWKQIEEILDELELK